MELDTSYLGMRLPHPLHLHCNNLGTPGNVSTTLETMKVLEGNRAHMAHLQFHAYGGDDWHTMRSEAAALAAYFNAHPNLTADELMFLLGAAYSRFYIRPTQIANHLGIQSTLVRDVLTRLDNRVFARQARREVLIASRAVSC